MAEATRHIPHHIPPHIPQLAQQLAYVPITQGDGRSFIEQALEDMEQMLEEKQEEFEMEELFSRDILSLLEQEEQESLEENIKKSSSHHWRALPGLYKLPLSSDSLYDDEEDLYDGKEDYSDYSSLSFSTFSENQDDDYGIMFHIYDHLADAMGDFEDISYKLTREVLGDRFAEITKSLMDEMIDE